MEADPPGSAAAALAVSTKAFELLRQLVEARTGLHYPPERAPLLAGKLTDLVVRHGLRSFLDLYYRLRYDEDEGRLWAEVTDHLSVPETFFWRQPEQLRAVAELGRAAVEAGRRLRVWSAACCSGEEPLSIAIALEQEGVPLDRVTLTASDASPRMVERARRGIYSDRSVRLLPSELRARYLVSGPDGWRVDPDLHRRIEWRVANLVRPEEVIPLARVDVVFCRNVFIYFSDDTVRRVVDSFDAAMPPGGALFLGAAESLLRMGGPFQLEERAGAFFYRKVAGGTDGEPGARPPAPPHPRTMRQRCP